MHREEKVLSVGYLVKSPTRSKDKSNLPMFWKLRWCVFAKITFKDRFGIVQETKLLLSYYEDKQAYQNHDPAKGCLNITNCINIRSCFKSQAGFDHLFCIEWSKDIYVKFSAQSCQKKFTWITILYNNKFDTILRGVRRSEVISKDSIGKERLSRLTRRRSTSFENFQLENSNWKSTSQSLSSIESLVSKDLLICPEGSLQNEEPTKKQRSTQICRRKMPLPPLPDEKAVEKPVCGCPDGICKDCKGTNNGQMKWRTFGGRKSGSTQPKHRRAATFTENDNSWEFLNDYDSLFMLCERCQGDGNSSSKKKNSINRRLSSKKRDRLSKDDDNGCEVQEIHNDLAEAKDNDDPSSESLGPDEFIQNGSENIYVSINDDWLERVRLLVSQSSDNNNHDDDDDDGDDDNDDDVFLDNDIYVKMNIFLHAPTVPLPPEVSFAPKDEARVSTEASGVSEDETNLPTEVSHILKDANNGPIDDCRLFTDGNSGPTEVTDVPKDAANIPRQLSRVSKDVAHEPTEVSPVPEDAANLLRKACRVPKDAAKEPKEVSRLPKDAANVPRQLSSVSKYAAHEPTEVVPVPEDAANLLREAYRVPTDAANEPRRVSRVPKDAAHEPTEVSPVPDDAANLLREACRLPKDAAHEPTGLSSLPKDSAPVLLEGVPKPKNILPEDAAVLSRKLPSLPPKLELPLRNVEKVGVEYGDVARMEEEDIFYSIDTPL